MSAVRHVAVALVLGTGVVEAAPPGFDEILHRCGSLAPALSSTWYACVGNTRRAASPVDLVATCRKRETFELVKRCFGNLHEAQQPGKIVAACDDDENCARNAIGAQDAATEAECRSLAPMLQDSCIAAARTRLEVAQKQAKTDGGISAGGLRRLEEMRRPDLAMEACRVGPLRGDACLDAVAELDRGGVDPRQATRWCIDGASGAVDRLCMNCLDAKDERGRLCSSLQATGLSLGDCVCEMRYPRGHDEAAVAACFTRERAGKPRGRSADLRGVLSACGPPAGMRPAPDPAGEHACRALTGGAEDDMEECRNALVDDGGSWATIPRCSSFGAAHAPDPLRR